jgi:hypothetical protein
LAGKNANHKSLYDHCCISACTRLRLGALSRIHLLALPSFVHVCAIGGQKTTKYSVMVLRLGAGRRTSYSTTMNIMSEL